MVRVIVETFSDQEARQTLLPSSQTVIHSHVARTQNSPFPIDIGRTSCSRESHGNETKALAACEVSLRRGKRRGRTPPSIGHRYSWCTRRCAICRSLRPRPADFLPTLLCRKGHRSQTDCLYNRFDYEQPKINRRITNLCHLRHINLIAAATPTWNCSISLLTSRKNEYGIGLEQPCTVITGCRNTCRFSPASRALLAQHQMQWTQRIPENAATLLMPPGLTYNRTGR